MRQTRSFPAHQAATPVAAGDVPGASLGAPAIVTALLLGRLRLGHDLAAAQVTGAVIALLSLATPLSVHASAGIKAALAAMHPIAVL